MRTHIRSLSGLILLAAALQHSVWSEEAVAQLNDDLYIGKPVSIDNVTVWPVYAKKEFPKLGEFIDLKEAESKKLAVVREIGVAGAPEAAGGATAAAGANAGEDQQQVQADQGDAARVNEVVIENKSDKPILVLAGTLVKGGKQDRQIAEDFIIPAGKTVSVDAFCVESGRWTGQREGQATGGRFGVQDSLTTFAVRGSAQRAKNQGEVWDKVAKENIKAAKTPETATYQAVVEETDKAALETRKKILTHVEEGFAALSKKGERPLGLAYAIDGKVREIRSFVQPEIFQRYQKTLMNTIAIEGDLAQREASAGKKEIFKKVAAAEHVPDLIKQVNKNKMERIQTKSGSVVHQKRDDKVIGNGTYLEGKEDVPVTSNWTATE
jgi:hypothetical protein